MNRGGGGGGGDSGQQPGDLPVAFPSQLSFPPWHWGAPGCVSGVNSNYSASHPSWTGEKEEELIWGEKA